MNRILAIDALRGISVVTMIAANAAAYILVSPHPLWFRAYGTFAAAIFVFLSGMMVGNGLGDTHPWTYYAKRGAWIMAYGAALDVLVFRLIPGTTVDVLYMIGLSLPLTALVTRLPHAMQWITCAAVFLLAPLLQHAFGYTDYQYEYHLDGTLAQQMAHPTSILAHWLIDGWFPLFPWLGFAILGALCKSLFSHYGHMTTDHKRLFQATAWILLALGMSIWIASPGALLIRGHYSELFYPPTLGYCVTAIGIIFVLYAYVHAVADHPLVRWCNRFGRASLLVYVLHYVLIEFVLVPVFGMLPMTSFIAVYIGFVAALWTLMKGIHAFVPPKSTRPLGVRLLLGS